MSDSNSGELFISTKSDRAYFDMSQIAAIMPYYERAGDMIYKVYLSNSTTILIKEGIATELFDAISKHSKE